MDNNIPNKVVREIISEILAERGNSVDNKYYRLRDDELNIDGETAKKIGINARLNSILADKVLQGEVPVKEVIDLVLTPDEVKKATIKCDQWMEYEKQSEINL